MRNLAIFLVILLLSACSTAPVAHNQSQAVNPTPGATSGSQKASMDSVVQFLLASASSDFHAQRASHIAGFRDVHLRLRVSSSGEKTYLLCGQALTEQPAGNSQWIPFATIKTSGYEQYIGVQAETICQGTSIVSGEESGLSSVLQNRFDSLK